MILATVVPPSVPVLPSPWPYGDVALTALLGAGLAVLVGVAVLLRRRGVSGEATRTLVHAATALAVAAIPWLFASPLGPMALAAAFCAVNLWAIRHRKLGALHAARPESFGTVSMPLALVLLGAWTLAETRSGLYNGHTLTLYEAARVQWTLAWTVLALADPLAGWAGRRFGPGGPKSWAGSGTFFVATALIVGIGYGAWKAACSVSGPGLPACYADALVQADARARASPVSPLRLALTVAAVATACEWLGRRGWDNLLVVLGAFFALAFLYPHDATRPFYATWYPVPIAALFAFFSYRARMLSASGAVAAGLFAWLVLEVGSWTYLLSGAGFFVLSSLLSKWNRRRSASAEALVEKGHRRDAVQVAANGFVAAAALAGVLPLVLDCLGLPVSRFYVWALWLGAFAAAAADTWATEIGTRFGGTPRLVTTGRKVPRGTSGGVSGAGLLGALAGALAVGALSFVGSMVEGRVSLDDGPRFVRNETWGLVPSGPWEMYAAAALVYILTIAAAAGLAGALADSVLGATLQRRYRLPDGTLTEKPTTDGVPNAPAGGLRWMTNDTVNLLATLVGALVAAFTEPFWSWLNVAMFSAR